MALTTEERTKVLNGIMRWWSSQRETVTGLSKGDLAAAIAATDNWIDDNQASFNSALPAAARDNLTLAQKTFLFCILAIARVSLDFLRRVIGEVD